MNKCFRYTVPSELSISDCLAILSTSLLVFLVTARVVDFNDTVLQVISTLIATFIGAFLVFSLERRRDRERQREADHLALRMSHFVIAARYNFIHNANVAFTDYRVLDNPAGMMPITQFSPPKAELQIESLQFLLETEYAQLLFEISLFERHFWGFISSIEERNKIHDRIQNEFSSSSIDDSGMFESQLPEAVAFQLQSATEILFDSADRIYSEVEDLNDRIQKAAHEIFPGFKSISAVNTEKLSDEK